MTKPLLDQQNIIQEEKIENNDLLWAYRLLLYKLTVPTPLEMGVYPRKNDNPL